MISPASAVSETQPAISVKTRADAAHHLMAVLTAVGDPQAAGTGRPRPFTLDMVLKLDVAIDSRLEPVLRVDDYLKMRKIIPSSVCVSSTLYS